MQRRTEIALRALVGVALLGCGSERQHRAAWPRQVAAGRPATCPEGAVDPWGDGTLPPDAVRCTYDDALGGQAVRVRGFVRRAGPDPIAPGVPDAEVQIRRREAGGGEKVVATTRTDAQGGFGVTVVLPRGRYEVEVVGQGGRQGFEVGPGGPPPAELTLMLPEVAAD